MLKIDWYIHFVKIHSITGYFGVFVFIFMYTCMVYLLQKLSLVNGFEHIFLMLLRGRIFAKRINVRIEHVRHSKCRDDFLR